MPKEIKIMGYTIKELKPEVQEKVIEDNSEINTDYNWYDGNYEGFAEILAEYGLNCDFKHLTWDLYNNTFEFNTLEISDKNKLLSSLGISLYLIPLEIATNGSYEIELDLHNSCVSIYCGEETPCELSKEDIEQIEKTIEVRLDNLITDLSGKFLKSLKEDYDDITSKEAIIDTLDINEYLFTEDGKRI